MTRSKSTYGQFGNNSACTPSVEQRDVGQVGVYLVAKVEDRLARPSRQFDELIHSALHINAAFLQSRHCLPALRVVGHIVDSKRPLKAK